MDKVSFYTELAALMNKHGVAGISGAYIVAGEDLDIGYMNVTDVKDAHAHALGLRIVEKVKQYVEGLQRIHNRRN
jgi:hypothetical protein